MDFQRHRAGSDLAPGRPAGLVKGEGFAVDASVMEADASRYHGKAPDEIDWSAPERQTRAVSEFLARELGRKRRTLDPGFQSSAITPYANSLSGSGRI